MPRTVVVFYQEEEGDVPVLDWLDRLRRTDRRAYEHCVAAIERLAELGHELRSTPRRHFERWIYELRIRKGRVNYRILHFFHGRNLAILGHALTKEAEVPESDIEKAIRRKSAFKADPATHAYSEDERG